MKNRLNKVRWLLGIGGMVALGLSLAVANSTVVVSPINTQGWGFAFDSGAAGSGELVDGPGMPPLGSGSARLAVTNAATGIIIVRAGFNGVKLADITKLQYSTYRTAGGAAQGISLQFSIDDDLTDGDDGFKGRLVFEAYYSETVNTGEWQTWNTMTQGRWWGTRAPINTVCSIGSPCTWAQVLTNFPNAGIHNVIGAVLFKAGSGWASFDGNVDGFTIGINGDETTYNFEYVTPIEIDIKPGSPQNAINLGSAGVVPVAMLSSDSFDATQIDPASVALAGAKVRLVGRGNKYLCQTRDVNGDGRKDLVCDVETASFLIEPGDTMATLEAMTFAGHPVRGQDIIRIVP
jgi:hypothetical protein